MAILLRIGGPSFCGRQPEPLASRTAWIPVLVMVGLLLLLTVLAVLRRLSGSGATNTENTSPLPCTLLKAQMVPCLSVISSPAFNPMGGLKVLPWKHLIVLPSLCCEQ